MRSELLRVPGNTECVLRRAQLGVAARGNLS